MKISLTAIIFSFGLNAWAIDERAGEVCLAMAEYNTEKSIYDTVKQNMEAQGLDINEIEPETVAKVKALKARFDREKRKYETKTKRKFKKNMCEW